ncbi:phage minor tail protein L [Xenorhabdus thuongxuanensis]|uniref:Phage minor tail protein L n=1 Tax=Xenorhabdus thuongxuanensis TaxID=1873484 RepID=A0A1Q5TM20_9GAMM|nr:phage minor tail protein L [Xenorhabdus thuongxuanensis]
MKINADLQRLEAGNKILLFAVDGSVFGGPELYFHNYPVTHTESDLEDPTQEKIDVFYIDSKTNEDNESVQFALSSPADLQGIQIPTRQIHSLCTWCRGGMNLKAWGIYGAKNYRKLTQYCT